MQGQDYKDGLASLFHTWIRVVKALNKHGEASPQNKCYFPAPGRGKDVSSGMFYQPRSVGGRLTTPKDAQVPPPLV